MVQTEIHNVMLVIHAQRTCGMFTIAGWQSEGEGNTVMPQNHNSVHCIYLNE